MDAASGGKLARWISQLNPAWALAVICLALLCAFIVDRVTMTDRWTRTDHFTWAERLAKEEGAYRARADAELKVLRSTMAAQEARLRALETNTATTRADVRHLVATLGRMDERITILVKTLGSIEAKLPGR